MKVIVVKDQAAGGKEGFKVFKNALDNGAKVFGLATGSTPVTTYKEIVNSDLDFSDCTSVNLDEYVGIAPDNDQSYKYFMQTHLFNDKPFKESFLPNGLASDPEAEVKRYDKVIDEHPIELQILGIGRNGHIGFNEPGTPRDITAHVVDLTESTIEANARFFASENDVPKQAFSMGLASIMKSKHLLLEAFGENKADAVKGMIEGPDTPELPASILQNHPDVTVIIDEAAASKLSKKY
ncbi:glucosamine-6-phosphate deaminase [Lactiplantibacillus plantarum]|uniref:glucosamine-6-phosphate deaminase n=1 Tax=Lactiplantibacillus plantarum TaxID=1590 RepID=UPI0007BAECCE|nr:glucosamine-6-phosphate deaminase [Lactiplantibacillus plantarum]AYE59238.1 glucosamine-6-phosphate deaminase [Lactiplantibacillus plantarum]KZU47350.1 Glucosamine-6-phosphate deaminase [Lactiplantibacillus plantarum]MCG0574451.1 glucosamine-6-phosphate isomerase [Lactiplantibacillus plantarum]QBJ56905.1 glucosamine-6-phosphate deaminase [Lactiplantibacillus plantarum]RDG27637.1 glucosamine-6-phosphate deaminase [Lactiplantibacillus plantarum]